MTTTTIPAGRTYDRLADPDKRTIDTTWATGETNDEGSVRIVVQTRYSKQRKRLTTDIHTATLNPRGFLVRSFMVYGPASADGGLDLAATALARFSQRTAVEQHRRIVDALTDGSLTVGDGEVAQRLQGLFAGRLPLS